jgi:hypothetical protein
MNRSLLQLRAAVDLRRPGRPAEAGGPMPLSFPAGWHLQWGGSSPELRGMSTSRIRSFMHLRSRAGVDAGRRTGVLPHRLRKSSHAEQTP